MARGAQDVVRHLPDARRRSGVGDAYLGHGTMVHRGGVGVAQALLHPPHEVGDGIVRGSETSTDALKAKRAVRGEDAGEEIPFLCVDESEIPGLNVLMSSTAPSRSSSLISVTAHSSLHSSCLVVRSPTRPRRGGGQVWCSPARC